MALTISAVTVTVMMRSNANLFVMDGETICFYTHIIAGVAQHCFVETEIPFVQDWS